MLLVSDGPNAIESMLPLVERLRHAVRVVCFDMPGFGFSVPSVDYDHSLEAGASVVLVVISNQDVRSATLAFGCANGL